MARKPRLHLPGGIYHAMLRGNAGQSIFFSDEDRYRLYLLLQEGIARFNYRMHGFCLMDNHLHLAIQVTDIPLSKIMQNLAFRYTQWINKRERRTGHLFQGRYKAILVEKDNYLLELVRYLHLNPVRAGLVTQPEDYPWSGHLAYLGQEVLPWLTTQWVLSQFNREQEPARRGYQQFVHEGIGLGHEPRFHQGNAMDRRILGEDGFAERLLKQGHAETAKPPSLEAIIDAVLTRYQLSADQLQAPGSDRHTAQARALIALVVQRTGAATLTALGQRLNRDVATLSTGSKRLSIKIRNKGTALEPWGSVLEQFHVKL